MLLDAVLDGVPWDPGSAAASDTAVPAGPGRAGSRPAGRPGWRTRCSPPPASTRGPAGQLAEMVAGYPGQHWTRPRPAQAGPAAADRHPGEAWPCRSWWLVGEHDVPCFSEMSAVLARRIPGARYHVVRGAGHMINMEQPAAVNELLASFLAQPPRISDGHR